MQITVVHSCRHSVKAPVPLVIRMEQNHVRLDAELLQIRDALFKVLKVFWIELREIPVRRRWIAKERIQDGFVRVPGIALRKNAEADFVEWRRCQRFERLCLQRLVLQLPDVARCPEL